MNQLTISGALFRDMMLMGAALLEKNKASIDALNVFPVPDGDTGTNMSMTMQSAVKEIKHADTKTVSDVAAAASLGALKGARGNSGVILSQLFRGFARALKDLDEMDAASFSNALTVGTDAAYKAVMKPKEGTILTVSRCIAEGVAEACASGANVYKLIDKVLESGEVALANTPNLLPVLKEAGVIDSGGKGLLTIYRGFKMAIDGEELDDIATSAQEEEVVQTNDDIADFDSLESIQFGYCTEFFITHLTEDFSEEELDKLREKLVRIGDSVVLAHDEGIVKVHVHSNVPGKILQLALRLGEIDSVKIENMRQQNRDIQANLKANEKEYGIITVCAGTGVATVFKDLGASYVIEGGQTMNPSIDTIAKAIRKVNARNVFIFPNNSNIILAAKQASELSDRNVIIIPTKDVMQGISGVMAFNPELSPAENENRMTAAFTQIVSGSVTYAVRNTSYHGAKIEEGNIIGLMAGDIVCVGDSVEDISAQLVDKMIAAKEADDCIVTIFYGESMDEDNAKALSSRLEGAYPDAEFIIQQGGQPLYYYYFSVE